MRLELVVPALALAALVGPGTAWGEDADGGLVAVDAGVERPSEAAVPPTPTPMDAGSSATKPRPEPRVETPRDSMFDAAPRQGGDLLETLLGGTPLGTSAWVRPHGEFALLMGSERAAAAPNDPVSYTGFRYAERAGLLTSFAGIGLASASAQATANATGKRARINAEGHDAAGLGLAFELRTSERFLADLTMAGPVSEFLGAPFVLEFGLSAGWVKGAPTGGVLLRAAAPLTRWAAVDGEWHLMAVGSEFQAGLHLLPGNRFFGRAAVLYTPGAGPGTQFSVGVRL